MRDTLTLPRTARNERRKTTANRYVTVEGTRIRYIAAGLDRQGPPLLMVHGYNGSSDYFLPRALPSLAEERPVIAPDLPGNGLSGRLRKHTFDAYVSFLPRFLDALGVEKADLLGHSMGGQIAIAAAAASPDRFRTLILVDSAGLPELIPRRWLVPVRSLADPCMRDLSFYPTLIRTALRARAAMAGLGMLRRNGIRPLLCRISLPTLIVWGTRDCIVPPEHGVVMSREIPGAKLALMEGAGHMPFYERPHEFSRIVLDFLSHTPLDGSLIAADE